MNDNWLVFKRAFRNRAHEKSLFTIRIYPDIKAEFGEPKSKLNSKQYRLTQIEFQKDRYSDELIADFLQRFHVKYIRKDNIGKKLPPIYRVIGRPDKLVRGGYIIICENSSPLRETYKKQDSYDFWLHEFYEKSTLSSDTETLNKAIPLLLDRIDNNKDFFKQIPHSDSRIFEEIVAEIFRAFDYEVKLTNTT